MQININVTGAQETRDKIAQIASRLRDLKPAYLRAGVAVLTDAQGRIRANGPGWAPTAETSKGSPLQRTGALFRSLTINDSDNIAQDLPNGIRVGTGLRTPDGRYSIGRLLQYGRGPITPKNGKFLVFELNGQKIFTKKVGPAPPRPFLYINTETAEKVANIFKQRIIGEF